MTFPLVPCPKPEPKIVAKVLKRRKVARMDRQSKEAVRQRDHECCRVCFRRSREVHERLFKSLGGVASSVNSLVLCKKCHGYAHAHGMKVLEQLHADVGRGLQGCNGKLVFQMCAAVAHDIFRGRAVPKHVEVIG
jgi:hypothetical protein